MHIHRLATITPWPQAEFGSIRLWDAGVAWPNLEPRKGEWHFENLDLYVNQALDNKVEILLPLGLSPNWASARPSEKSGYGPGNAAEPMNMEDWRNYVRKVATRYKGKVHYYEIWNEPNLSLFYTGNVQQMLDLTREANKILKQVSADNQVVCPAATSGMAGVAWLKEFLGKGGGKYVDIVGFHFYANSPEEQLPIISAVRRAMADNGIANMQLWDTEATWPIVNHASPNNSNGRTPLSDEMASAYIARSYVLQWAAGVQRYFFYSWDNKVSGLTEVDGKTVKPPAEAYVNIQRWLRGSRLDYCRGENNGIWVAHVVRQDASTAWIVWSTNGRVRWTPPRQARVRSIIDISGKQIQVSRDGVDVDAAPMLLSER